MTNLPDIQDTKPDIRIKLQRVGVDNVEVPFCVALRDGTSAQIVAKAEMFCELNRDIRGVSMSRFIRTLQPYLEKPIRRTLLETILKDIMKQVESNVGSIKFDFKIPIKINSPISNNSFLQYYPCSFKCDAKFGRYKFYESVRVQYSSYCPCSAALCKERGVGYPHNQRSFADVVVSTNPTSRVWIEDIIDLVIGCVRTIPYPIIQRNDEGYIAELATIHTQFVEDAIRRISKKLQDEKHINDWLIKCTHEESIHTSNAVAINWKGIEGGFNENSYI